MRHVQLNWRNEHVSTDHNEKNGERETTLFDGMKRVMRKEYEIQPPINHSPFAGWENAVAESVFKWPSRADSPPAAFTLDGKPHRAIQPYTANLKLIVEPDEIARLPFSNEPNSRPRPS
jgi:hypothetical protein